MTALIVLAAALRSRDILVWYHVQVLRRDPQLMPRWRVAPPDSLEAEALRSFLRTRTGVLRLRQHIVTAILELGAKNDPGFLPQNLGKGRFLQFGVFELANSRYLLMDGAKTLAKPLPAESEILAWGSLLESLGSGDFELAEHPGILFTIWTYREDSGRGPLVVEGSLTRRS